MILFLSGAAGMTGILFLLGITRGRFVRQKTWVVLWFSLSVVVAGFIVVSRFFPAPGCSSLALGLSLGYVVGIAIHTLGHFLEELRAKKPPSR